MPLLTIIKYPDPILRQKCSDVCVFDDKLCRLIDDMFETMTVEKGVGLAAPQIGILQNILVLAFEKKKLALINPKIISQKGTLIQEEGCLSCPNALVMVSRADHIVIQAKTKKGKPVTIREKGFISRIIQHEMDHLQGIVILDRGSNISDQIRP